MGGAGGAGGGARGGQRPGIIRRIINGARRLGGTVLAGIGLPGRGVVRRQ